MTRTHRTNRRPRGDPTTDRPADGQTLADVSHTHPFSDDGAINRPFQRGPTVVADGGQRDAVDEDERVEGDDQADGDERTDADGEAADESEDEPARPRLKDVDHTPPYGNGEEVDRVFERGGKEEPVASEE